MEVVPERRVGPFKLGMLVSVAVHELQAMKPTPHVHLTFDERGVRGLDMVLDAPDLGMRLRFEPRTQRLHLIDVYAMGRVALFYKRRHDPKRRFFCAPATLPTFRLVYDVRPGEAAARNARCATMHTHPLFGLAEHVWHLAGGAV